MLRQKQKPPLSLKPMPHQKLMPGTDADTVMEDMEDTGMAVMVLDTDVDTMAITLARDPLMPPQKPMPGTAVDTAVDTVMVVTDTAVDTVMVVTDTASKKLIVPISNVTSIQNYAIILPNQVITHYQKQHHRCLLTKTL